MIKLIALCLFLSLPPVSTSTNKALRQKEMEPVEIFQSLNLTKRPLNFYILANGKHAVVVNKSVEGDGKLKYRLTLPPFSIKNRGCVLLLPNETGSSLAWHRGYPSLLQMLAASGHTIIAADLLLPVEKRLKENVKNLKWISEVENIANRSCVLVSERRSFATALQYLAQIGTSDGFIIVKNNFTSWAPGNSLIATKTLIGKDTPTVIAISGDEGLADMNGQANGGRESKGWIKAVNYADGINNLAQVIVNFLDFVHPR